VTGYTGREPLESRLGRDPRSRRPRWLPRLFLVSVSVTSACGVERPNRTAVSVVEGAALGVPVSATVGGDPWDAGCRTSFIVTPACRFCVRLADRPDVAASHVDWLVLGGEEELERWVEAVPSARARSFGLLETSSHEVLRVPVTPVRLVLNDDGIVVDYSASQALPSDVELDELCTAS
jgi:hypothetical protein